MDPTRAEEWLWEPLRKWVWRLEEEKVMGKKGEGNGHAGNMGARLWGC